VVNDDECWDEVGGPDHPIITVRLAGWGGEMLVTPSGPLPPPPRTTAEHAAAALALAGRLTKPLRAFFPSADVRRARLSWRVPGGPWHHVRHWRVRPEDRWAYPGWARPAQVRPAAAAAGYRRRR
jgi:hypothetical protein